MERPAMPARQAESGRVIMRRLYAELAFALSAKATRLQGRMTRMSLEALDRELDKLETRRAARLARL
jgi:hypothetical protein